MTFRGQLARLIRKGQILCLQPDGVSDFKLGHGARLGYFI
jgi:hypothetical protein